MPRCSVIANTSRQTWLTTDHQVSRRSSRGCRTGRLLPHLRRHFLFHFLQRRFSLVRAHHPRVSLWVYYRSATIATKHVHYLALGCGSETHSLGDYFVDVFHVEKQARWRSANGLSAALTQRGVFRSQHQSRATQRQLRMDRLAIGTVHDAALGKAEGLLIKGHGSRYIGDCKHGRYRAVLFFFEGIYLLFPGAPFGNRYFMQSRFCRPSLP